MTVFQQRRRGADRARRRGDRLDHVHLSEADVRVDDLGALSADGPPDAILTHDWHVLSARLDVLVADRPGQAAVAVPRYGGSLDFRRPRGHPVGGQSCVGLSANPRLDDGWLAQADSCYKQ